MEMFATHVSIVIGEWVLHFSFALNSSAKAQGGTRENSRNL